MENNHLERAVKGEVYNNYEKELTYEVFQKVSLLVGGEDMTLLPSRSP